MAAVPQGAPVPIDPVQAEYDRLARAQEAAGGPVDFGVLRPQVKAFIRANPQLLVTPVGIDRAAKRAEDAYIDSRSVTGWQPGSGPTTQLMLDLPIAPDNLIALSDQQRLYQRASIASYDQLMTHRRVREDAVQRMLGTHNAAIAEIDEALQNWARAHRQLRDVWRDLYGYTGP